MKKRVLIISEHATGSSFREVFSSTSHINFDVEFATYKDAVFVFSKNRNEVILSSINSSIDSYDLVYLRKDGQSQSLSSALVAIYPQIDFLRTHRYPVYGSKLVQYASFARDQLPFAKTIFVNSDDVDYVINWVEKYLKYPVVYKAPASSKGKNCFIAYNHADLISGLQLNNQSKMRYLFQEYIPNNYDYRVLVFDNKVRFALKRVRQQEEGTWKNNTALGATEIDVPLEELSESVKELAIQAANSVGLQICGADITQSLTDNNYYLFEVNSSPGFSVTEGQAFVTFLDEYLTNTNGH